MPSDRHCAVSIGFGKDTNGSAEKPTAYGTKSVASTVSTATILGSAVAADWQLWYGAVCAVITSKVKLF
jgi:hypothetical protein